MALLSYILFLTHFVPGHTIDYRAVTVSQLKIDYEKYSSDPVNGKPYLYTYYTYTYTYWKVKKLDQYTGLEQRQTLRACDFPCDSQIEIEN